MIFFISHLKLFITRVGSYIFHIHIQIFSWKVMKGIEDFKLNFLMHKYVKERFEEKKKKNQIMGTQSRNE